MLYFFFFLFSSSLSYFPNWLKLDQECLLLDAHNFGLPLQREEWGGGGGGGGVSKVVVSYGG